MVSKDHYFLTENFHPLNRFFWCVSVFLTFILTIFLLDKGGGGVGSERKPDVVFSILVYICFVFLKKSQSFAG